ncbi:DUF72 domain-containing protein [Micromonospora sp. CPCC 205558]|uniref:DUF72 domain-containing protein n=1 Tax=Micromonospora sp. CPCC 205558 TaxID=3122403 RepID=UPI002FF0A222
MPGWGGDRGGHVRLHEGRARPWPRYGRAALRSWVRRLTDVFGADEPAYVYFNNDPGGAAIVDAVAFAALARRAGHPVSRVPTAAEATGADG